MAKQKEFVYLLEIKNGPNSMATSMNRTSFMGIFKTKEAAEAYAKRNKETEDGVYFCDYQGLAGLEEIIHPRYGLPGELWIIREKVLLS